MAVDMFIKIGDLKGESRDATHKGVDRRSGMELGYVEQRFGPPRWRHGFG